MTRSNVSIRFDAHHMPEITDVWTLASPRRVQETRQTEQTFMCSYLDVTECFARLT